MSKRDGSRLRQHRLSGFPIWLTSDLARAEGLTGGPGNVNFRTKFAFLQNHELLRVPSQPPPLPFSPLWRPVRAVGTHANTYGCERQTGRFIYTLYSLNPAFPREIRLNRRNRPDALQFAVL